MDYKLILVLAAVALVGCTAAVDKTERMENPASEAASWLTAELKDVRTGKTFSVADFDKPVLIESFAVWCPTCKKQQDRIKEFHEEVGDSVVSISLDTDPNEDEAQVLEHVNRNGYEWFYAIAPKEVSQALIDDFGVSVVNAPQAPVILVCPDGSSGLLKRGVKSVDELKAAVAGCTA